MRHTTIALTAILGALILGVAFWPDDDDDDGLRPKTKNPFKTAGCGLWQKRCSVHIEAKLSQELEAARRRR